MKKSEYFVWIENICICTINNQYGSFEGAAFCHPEDNDMCSKRTGEQISYHRAIIKSLQHERDNILIPQIKALEHAISLIKMKENAETPSDAFNILKRQLNNYRWQLITIRQLLIKERKELRNYIQTKEKMYQKIRRTRCN